MTMDRLVAETPGMITKADGDPGQAVAIAEGGRTEVEVEAADIGVTRGEAGAEDMEVDGEYDKTFLLSQGFAWRWCF
jgi:hypothetical protein